MKVWPDTLHQLKQPPVVETAIGVQFAPIAGLTSAHAGWYWKDRLDTSWVKVQETAALDDQFESFQQSWTAPIMRLAFSPLDKPPIRVQIAKALDDRVIQIQSTRFIYNWRKRNADYPSFRITSEEFLDQLASFRQFLTDVGLGDIQPNQWELSYIDHIPRGELWDTPKSFWRVFPGLYSEPFASDTVKLEAGSAEQHYEITPQHGRVHVVSQHGKLPDGNEILLLQTTARGPIDFDRPDFGLGLGHEAIGRIFLAISSDSALRHWGAEL